MVDAMPGYVQIFTTTDDKRVASRISKTLVDKRLAPCVQVLGPISSRCWWKGKKVSSTEWLLIAKTKGSLYKKAEAAIKSVHNYRVPEILAVPVLDGNVDYLRWLEKETKK